MKRKALAVNLLTLAFVLVSHEPGTAQQSQGCFAGSDFYGQPTMMVLQAEKYGDFFEIFGTVSSPSIGTMRVKADGWSGAGRLFQGHEYESGAVYISIRNFTGASLVLDVEGYGSFPFRAVAC